MNILDIINKKRLNFSLSKGEIEYVVRAYLDDIIKDYQMSSLLMAICINGMNQDEINYLTEAMINSGETIDLSNVGGATVDKHSTGGVGDKTTLIVAPIVASLGVKVYKMSGRGLGHTGGTIDKLESIPGFKVDLTKKQFLSQVNKINLSVVSQTANLVPADKKIYALRDVTGTVESIPLIASSIMSKKIALGASNIVIDLKVGSGALIKNLDDATELATIMINIGKKYKRKVVCLLSNMDIPLGYNVGNSLEIKEAISVLKNEGEENLTNLCVALASHMVSLALPISFDEAREKVINTLKSGDALAKFYEFINFQQGRIDEMKDALYKYDVKAPINGFLTNIDAYIVGCYACEIGCGRRSKEDVIDYDAGIIIRKKINDYVSTNDIVFTVFSNREIKDFQRLLDSLTISSKKIELPPLIYKVMS